MQANPVEAGASPDAIPGVVKVDQAGALLLARKLPTGCRGCEVGPSARQPLRTPSAPCARRLAVGEPHLAGVEVQIVPTQTQDFVAPAPGQHEKTDCRRRVDGRQPLGRRRP